MALQDWRVTLAGKWGGLRSVTVQAASAEQACRKARELAYSHERVSGASKAGAR